MVKKKDNENNPRREFIRRGLLAGAGALAASGVLSACGKNHKAGEKVKLLTPDGKLVEVDAADIQPSEEYKIKARKGIPGRKFVMVIDLAKCYNARKCVEACQEGHHLPKDHEYMKVYLMQDSEKSAPYWFPKPCFQCDNPLCVSVCPVGATYKRTDGSDANFV